MNNDKKIISMTEINKLANINEIDTHCPPKSKVDKLKLNERYFFVNKKDIKNNQLLKATDVESVPLYTLYVTTPNTNTMSENKFKTYFSWSDPELFNNDILKNAFDNATVYVNKTSMISPPLNGLDDNFKKFYWYKHDLNSEHVLWDSFVNSSIVSEYIEHNDNIQMINHEDVTPDWVHDISIKLNGMHKDIHLITENTYLLYDNKKLVCVIDIKRDIKYTPGNINVNPFVPENFERILVGINIELRSFLSVTFIFMEDDKHKIFYNDRDAALLIEGESIENTNNGPKVHKWRSLHPLYKTNSNVPVILEKEYIISDDKPQSQNFISESITNYKIIYNGLISNSCMYTNFINTRGNYIVLDFTFNVTGDDKTIIDTYPERPQSVYIPNKYK